MAVCKETFNLFYYESDGRHDTPDWNNQKYRKVDTIAADKRFKPGERNASNVETREIGPLSKKGLYVAIQVIKKTLVLGLIWPISEVGLAKTLERGNRSYET